MDSRDVELPRRQDRPDPKRAPKTNNVISKPGDPGKLDVKQAQGPGNGA